MPTSNDTPSDLLPSATADATVTIETTNYVQSVRVVVTKGSSTGAENAKRITQEGKLTAKPDGKNVKVTIAKDAQACKGDFYKITVTDTNGQESSKTYTFE